MISLEAKSVDDFVWLVREFCGPENPAEYFSVCGNPFVHTMMGQFLAGEYTMIASGDGVRVNYFGAVTVTAKLLSDLAAGGVIFASTRAELEACGVVCHKDQR